jgi:cellulose synthase/poly-beta-1,6-N-acetylglucosamine synthase-like glycosyltransferase
MTISGLETIRFLAWALLALPFLLLFVAYAAYPAMLGLARSVLGRRYEYPESDPQEWPSVTLVVPVYNEAAVIRDKLENLLSLDYPRDRRQVLIVSDASTDGTDAIVEEYADRGVDLIRLEGRGGKTAAENAARDGATGEIIVNTDATIRILPNALKRLVRVFQDPSVGVASGRDISVAPGDTEDVNPGELGYVSYEMWVRSLETDLGGIVGASGCFFAIRGHLFQTLVPEALSRDFASAMIAEAHGFRSVSVDDACCLVPRTGSLLSEYHRKVRTMARGLETLWEFRRLLNPFAHGRFALMLIAHKLLRWLVPLTLPLALLGLAALTLMGAIGWGISIALVLGAVVAVAIGTRWSEAGTAPAVVTGTSYLALSCVAGLVAWSKALAGDKNPIWEPTRR